MPHLTSLAAGRGGHPVPGRPLMHGLTGSWGLHRGHDCDQAASPMPADRIDGHDRTRRLSGSRPQDYARRQAELMELVNDHPDGKPSQGAAANDNGADGCGFTAELTRVVTRVVL